MWRSLNLIRCVGDLNGILVSPRAIWEICVNDMGQPRMLVGINVVIRKLNLWPGT